MVIDFHTHCFSDNIAKNAITQLESIGNIEAYTDGTAGGLISNMQKYGIDKSVVMPVATKPSQVTTINDWAISIESEQLCFFGALHPQDDNVYEVLKQLKNNGVKGVKLHPDYQCFFADEEHVMPIYEAMRDLGLVVVLHAGVDIGNPNFVHCTPLMISKIISSIRGIKLVAAHMGGHGLWRDVEDVLVGKEIYLDTSYSSYELGEKAMLRMIKNHGAERVLFGTDSPWTDAKSELEFINRLKLTSTEKDNILYKNALELIR